MDSTKVRSWYTTALAVVVLGAAGIFGTQAQAQTPTTTCDPNADPYGCVSTTTLAPGEVPNSECAVSDSTVEVGQRVDVTITDVPDGTEVTLTLGGQAVANGSAPSSSAEGYSDVAMSFTVPQLEPGRYQLVATGPGFAVECLAGEGGIQVLAAGSTQSPPIGGDRGGGGGGVGGGSLARTGLTIGGLLVAAAALVAGGRVLLGRSRRFS